MEKFNGLAVPPIVLWEELQERFCELSEGDTLDECVHDSCKTCLYFSENLNEFKTWFKSNLKNDEREDVQS